MSPEEFGHVLEQTLEDHRLSRGERRALREMVEDLNANEQQLAELRKLAFAKAAEAAYRHPEFKPILEWLEDVIKVLIPGGPDAQGTEAEAYFSPGTDCIERMGSFLRFARRSLEICVFTITDNRLTRAILEAHRKGVGVRIITDDEKSGDLGSDIEELRREGIEVRMDRSPHHMHHKFAIRDGRQLLAGSYNWTRSASMNNQENILIVNDARLIEKFGEEFERLWGQFG